MTNKKAEDLIETFTEYYPILHTLYAVYENIPQKDRKLANALEENFLNILELTVIMTRQKKELRNETIRQILTKIDAITVYFDLASKVYKFDVNDATKQLKKAQLLLKKIK